MHDMRLTDLGRTGVPAMLFATFLLSPLPFLLARERCQEKSGGEEEGRRIAKTALQLVEERRMGWPLQPQRRISDSCERKKKSLFLQLRTATKKNPDGGT